MKELKYTSLAVAALTATLLASTNNSKVQAATTDKNNTVLVRQLMRSFYYLRLLEHY